MLGTADITALGRPICKKARVYATVEEMSLSEKVIVFKKKRRQGY
jgi:ribosomal protein L21